MSQTLIWLKTDIISPLTCFWVARRTRYYNTTLGRATHVTTIFNPFSLTWMKIVLVWGKYSFICLDPPPDEAIPLWVSYCNAFSYRYILYLEIDRKYNIGAKISNFQGLYNFKYFVPFSLKIPIFWISQIILNPEEVQNSFQRPHALRNMVTIIIVWKVPERLFVKRTIM